VRHLTPQQASENFAPPVIYYSVTGIARVDGSRCIVSMEDPLAGETVRVGTNRYPLAADNFIHNPYFRSPVLNRLFSILESTFSAGCRTGPSGEREENFLCQLRHLVQRPEFHDGSRIV
jgi:hypothetical protein